MMALTRRQIELKAYIARVLGAGAPGPSVEEMRIALGLKTKSAVHAHLSDLERRGHIKRLRLTGARQGWAVKRAIEIVPPKSCSHCGRAIDA